MARPEAETPTDWELYLLHIVWENEPVKADDIREILRARKIKRSDSALRSTLRTMMDKGQVKGELRERTIFYEAAVKRPVMEKKIINHLIRTMFKGKQEEFILRVLDDSAITPEVVEKMKERIKDVKG